MIRPIATTQVEVLFQGTANASKRVPIAPRLHERSAYAATIRRPMSAIRSEVFQQPVKQ